MAAFHAIDLEGQNYIEKSNFLYTITSFINKMLSSGEDIGKRSQNDWSQQKNDLSQQKSQLT